MSPQPYQAPKLTTAEIKKQPKIALILRGNESNKTYYFCRKLKLAQATAILSETKFTPGAVCLDTELGQETLESLTSMQAPNVPWITSMDVGQLDWTSIDVIVSSTKEGDLIIDPTAPEAIVKVMSQTKSAHARFMCTPSIPEDPAENTIYRDAKKGFTILPNTVDMASLQRYLTAFPKPGEIFYFQSEISLASAQQYLPYLSGKNIFLGDYSTWRTADYTRLAQSVPSGTCIVFSKSIKQKYAEAFLAALTQRNVTLSLSSKMSSEKEAVIARAHAAYLSRISAATPAVSASASPVIPSGYFSGSSASASSSSAAASHPASSLLSDTPVSLKQ